MLIFFLVSVFPRDFPFFTSMIWSEKFVDFERIRTKPKYPLPYSQFIFLLTENIALLPLSWKNGLPSFRNNSFGNSYQQLLFVDWANVGFLSLPEVRPGKTMSLGPKYHDLDREER